MTFILIVSLTQCFSIVNILLGKKPRRARGSLLLIVAIRMYNSILENINQKMCVTMAYARIGDTTNAYVVYNLRKKVAL